MLIHSSEPFASVLGMGCKAVLAVHGGAMDPKSQHGRPHEDRPSEGRVESINVFLTGMRGTHTSIKQVLCLSACAQSQAGIVSSPPKEALW